MKKLRILEFNAMIKALWDRDFLLQSISTICLNGKKSIFLQMNVTTIMSYIFWILKTFDNIRGEK